MLDLKKVLLSLAKIKPVFADEKDFQDSFEGELKKDLSGSIQREYPVGKLNNNNGNGYIDFFINSDDKKIGIELKFIRNEFTKTVNDKLYKLKKQGANDVDRYSFIKDISDLENLVLRDKLDFGFAIVISNSKDMWGLTTRFNRYGQLRTDADFLTYENRVLNGELKWNSEKDFKNTITVKGTYCLHWEDYSCFPDQKNGLFRFLIIEVAG